MSANQPVRIISVRTIDGVTTKHTYELLDKAGIFSATTKRIGDAMRRRRRWLTLTQPFIIYRVPHIVAIEFDFDEHDEEGTRTLGFLQDR